MGRSRKSRISNKKSVSYQNTLKKDIRYNQVQKTVLMIKGEPFDALCRHCKDPISPGMLCFRVEGVLTVDFGTDKVIEKNLYFHATYCVTSSQPVWTNIRKPTVFEISSDVTKQQLQHAKNHCDLVQK